MKISYLILTLRQRSVALVFTLLSAFPLLHSGSAAAACSRTMLVPVAATGLSVVINGDEISGIYPDTLRSLSAKEACKFQFTAVPRARLEAMFEAGKADLLIPASKTPRRDQFGLFVPLIHNRATLISLQSNRPVLTSAQDLIERRELRVVLVRGFDYGTAYQNLVAELSKQGRVLLEPDPVSVARILKAKGAHLTIMAPSILAGAIQGDRRVEDLLGKLRYEAIPELPWGDSGAYLSKTALDDEDQASLRNLLEQASKTGMVWKSFQHYYPAQVLKESIRPLNPSR
ncbi:hypothetical protein BH11PSE12_BH11PSE12_24120 [soil metagenome]